MYYLSWAARGNMLQGLPLKRSMFNTFHLKGLILLKTV